MLEVLPSHLTEIATRLRLVTVEISCARGGGAGILWAADLIVTNAHVATATRMDVRLADDHAVEAQVVSLDRHADLALLRVPRRGLAPAILGDSDALRVGSVVVALGHPLGLRRTLTAGIVHAVAPGSAGGGRWIHADVHLAPGNSGGPLADADGRVVGVNTMIGGGLALAVPINDARRFVKAALLRAP